MLPSSEAAATTPWSLTCPGARHHDSPSSCRKPADLLLTIPYPDLAETWYEDEREWGWTLSPLHIIPDLRPAVEIAQRLHPSAGPAIDAADREQIREQLRSGLTPGQVTQAMGAKSVYWLTALEEEARLENELAAYPASPRSVAALRD